LALFFEGGSTPEPEVGHNVARTKLARLKR
jgi:hypothetical protein